MIANALWIVAPGRVEMRAEELPPPGEGDVAVRTLASGISRGTESLVLHGRVPKSQYDTMRAPMMGGAFPFPVKYGYSTVGRTSDGQRVFVLHPHQDALVVPRARCVRVPNAVPTTRAVLGANMETALNVVWDAAPLPGERILVVGAGVIGLLAASLCARIPGCVVTLADIDPARAAAAHWLGCRFTTPTQAPEAQELVIHASGTEAGLRVALRCAAFEGRIVEASWFGDAAPAVPLGEAFHARRLRLLASQVGAIAPALRGRRTHAERLALALDLLDDARLDALLEPPVRFADLPRVYPGLLRGGLCHVVDYEGA